MRSLLPVHLQNAEATLRDPTATSEELERLFQALRPLGLGPQSSDALFDETRRLIKLLAHNPNTPTPLLAKVAEMSHPTARAVAQNPSFSLTLTMDPLCQGTSTQPLLKAIAQRWPSDDQIAEALAPLVREALDHIEVDRKVEQTLPGFMAAYRKIFTKRYSIRDALMQHLNPNPTEYKDHLNGLCLIGHGWIHCGDLLAQEIRTETALAERLGLRFDRWFVGVPLPG